MREKLTALNKENILRDIIHEMDLPQSTYKPTVLFIAGFIASSLATLIYIFLK